MHKNPSVPAGSRRAIRRAVDLACEVVTARSDQPLQYMARDLSLDGVWVQTSEPLRTGEYVVVCFDPADEQSGAEIMVFAQVARVATARGAPDMPQVGMGLELLDLSDSERRRLSDWLGRRRCPVPRRRRPIPVRGVC